MSFITLWVNSSTCWLDWLESILLVAVTLLLILGAAGGATAVLGGTFDTLLKLNIFYMFVSISSQVIKRRKLQIN